MPDCGIQNATPDNPLGTPSLDPLCAVTAVASNAVTDALNSWKESVEQWMGEALGAMVRATSTSWVGISTPGLTRGDPEGNLASNSVGFLQDLTLWLSGAFLIAGFIWGMAHMALTGDSDHGINAVKGIFRYVVVWGIGVGTVGILVAVADELSWWFIDQATGDDFAAGMTNMVESTGGIAFILLVAFSIVGILVTGAQIILLFWRGGALVVLTAALALAASTSTNKWGNEVFAKYLGWLIAYILYKPAAALIYAAAFQLMSDQGSFLDQDKTIEHIAGISLMILALIALPAMIRLVSPISAAVASGRGAGAAMSGAAAMALPMGAMAVAAKSAGGAAESASKGAGSASGGGGDGGGSASGGPTGSAPPDGGGGGGGGGTTVPTGSSGGSSSGGGGEPALAEMDAATGTYRTGSTGSTGGHQSPSPVPGASQVSGAVANAARGPGGGGGGGGGWKPPKASPPAAGAQI